MKNSSNKSTETQLINAIRAGLSSDDLHAEYIAQHIRDVREVYSSVRAEWRTDGRDVLDILRSCDEVHIEAEDKKSTCYSGTEFYTISIADMQLRLGVNTRHGEECHAVELYYGSHYIFNAVFMLPESIVDTIFEAAEHYSKWQRQWLRMLKKCQKEARLKSMGYMAVSSYLKQKTKGLLLYYYISEQRNNICVYFLIYDSWKYKITVPLISFQQQIDQAIEHVVRAQETITVLASEGKILQTQSADEWTTSDI